MTTEEYVEKNVIFSKSLYDKFEVIPIYTNDFAIQPKDTTISSININGTNIYADAPFILIQYDKYKDCITLEITPIDIDEYSRFTVMLKENSKTNFSVEEDTLIIKIEEEKSK